MMKKVFLKAFKWLKERMLSRKPWALLVIFLFGLKVLAQTPMVFQSTKSLCFASAAFIVHKSEASVNSRLNANTIKSTYVSLPYLSDYSRKAGVKPTNFLINFCIVPNQNKTGKKCFEMNAGMNAVLHHDFHSKFVDNIFYFLHVTTLEIVFQNKSVPCFVYIKYGAFSASESGKSYLNWMTYFSKDSKVEYFLPGIADLLVGKEYTNNLKTNRGQSMHNGSGR